MRLMALILAAGAVLAPQSDEDKVIDVFKSYLKSIKESDFEKAVGHLHTKSVTKIRDRIVNMLDKTSGASQERFVKTLGYKDLEELKAATPRALFTAFLKNLKDLGEGLKQVAAAIEGADATVIGALKKDDKVYIVAEATFNVSGESHLTQFLQVAYREGDAWKLAHRGETNIGK